ncbi:sigma-54-dependent transcriptional regulator [Roseimaritima ulvae]|nr:sigma-54 dependent transcriptional regulator [Roseimaritima ulvae]
MPTTPIRLLLVDDEEDYLRSCVKYMQRKGHQVQGAASGAEAMSLLEQQSFEVAVFDMNMPGMNGLELMQRVREAGLDLEVVFLTGQGSVETAVSAMKLGACDYVTKPCSLGDLEHHCLLARDRNQLRKENKQLKAIVSRSRPAQPLIGESPAMKEVVRLIEKVAPTSKPVLIEGESGTGKEVVARAIQQRSALADHPFVTINCAALPEPLVESELFGHLKGAFTGATSDKPGLFEIADGGTLFIDEIGELPLGLQPKLLRVLEDGSLRRVGCHRERRVKVRLIAATNRHLADEVQAGRFREDLYYRINVLSLSLPPLRHREGDVQRLIQHLLPPHWSLDANAEAAMIQYHWPGNVRQLINVIERATILADDQEITLDDLPSEVLAGSGQQYGGASTPTATPTATPADEPPRSSLVLGSPDVTVDDLVKAHVLEVLAKQDGNKAKTARKLGIHRRKLYRLLERYEQNLSTEVV